MTYCYVCPHRCGVDRPESIHDATGTFGSCGVGMLPMVSRAALGVAMENGDERLKAIADYVTDRFDRDGFAKAVEKFILSEG